MLILCMTGWWLDVIKEGTYRGDHTLIVQRGLKWGFKLFILSEVMFFVGFFWSFFYSAFWPLYYTWPPLSYPVMEIWTTPFLNTIILIVSGFAVTWAHRGVTEQKTLDAIAGLSVTLVLSGVFLTLQVIEYTHSPFEISDMIFGSTFYILTGLHGFHVTVGVVFLIVCFIRLLYFHFQTTQHLGLVFAIWYWHFVDVVWIFLFLIVYVWGMSWPEPWVGITLIWF
jgi:heme/copper-type cytochrome/quinol oxidase subunit 3